MRSGGAPNAATSDSVRPHSTGKLEEEAGVGEQHAKIGAGLAALASAPRPPGNASKILIASTTGDSLRRIKQWHRYHRAIGVRVRPRSV